MIKTMKSTNVMRLGMASLVLGNVLPRVLDRGLSVGPDWTDGVKGFFIGASIVLMLVSMRMSPDSECRVKS